MYRVVSFSLSLSIYKNSSILWFSETENLLPHSERKENSKLFCKPLKRNFSQERQWCVWMWTLWILFPVFSKEPLIDRKRWFFAILLVPASSENHAIAEISFVLYKLSAKSLSGISVRRFLFIFFFLRGIAREVDMRRCSSKTEYRRLASREWKRSARAPRGGAPYVQRARDRVTDG